MRYAKKTMMFEKPRIPKAIPQACEATRTVTWKKSMLHLDFHLYRWVKKDESIHEKTQTY
jgi:hypothetical protein